MTEAPRAEPVRPVAVQESRGAYCGNVSATRAAKAYRSKTLETRNADRFAAPAPACSIDETSAFALQPPVFTCSGVLNPVSRKSVSNRFSKQLRYTRQWLPGKSSSAAHASCRACRLE